MTDQMICPICGEVTSSYMGNYRKDRLCKKHAFDLKNGKIIQCDNCGRWHEANNSCECSKIRFTELPTEGFYKCIACGTDTNGYAFCKKCFKEYTENEMLKMLNNTKFQHVIEREDIENKAEDVVPEKNADYDEQKNIITIDYNNKAKCITCGRQTDGLLFCSSCYHKYKNKELLFKITNCTSVELLDEDYEGKYTCDDGHIVKSKSEREIDNYLFNKGISHAYETELYYGAAKDKVLHPDFCLPNYLGKDNHVYIEHWGYNENNIQYTKTKKFKMSIYKKIGITLVCTHEKTDMGKIKAALDRKLNKGNIKLNEINFEETSD